MVSVLERKKRPQPAINFVFACPVVQSRSKKFRLAYFAVLCEVHEAEEALDLVGDLHLSLLVALHLVKAEKVEGLQFQRRRVPSCRFRGFLYIMSFHSVEGKGGH